MLIVPAHKPLNRHTLPVVTLVLLLVNVVVFFGLQSGDARARREAARFYLQSDLIEIEWPAFKQWAKVNDRDAYAKARELDEHTEGDAADRWRLLLMEHAGVFQQALAAGEIITPAHPAFETWREQRRTYESLKDAIFTESHLLRYDDVRIGDLFWSMFMHGSFMHLFGNMVFLVMLGLLVEGALNRGVFLAAYLVTGIGAAAASLALHWGEVGGMLGASGAIAGLMGLSTVLYNRRPVRFFYWAFVFFDYTKKPAIILLPIWVGWEALQLLINGADRVAYGAHIGGLITGAVIGGVILLLGWEKRGFLDEEVERDEDQATARAAMEDLRALRVARAKNRLQTLLPRHPDDPELVRTYYAACKTRAGDEDLHDAAGRVFALPGRDGDTRRLVIETARDYQKRVPEIELGDDALVRLVNRLAGWNLPNVAGGYWQELRRRARTNTALRDDVSRLARALPDRPA